MMTRQVCSTSLERSIHETTDRMSTHTIIANLTTGMPSGILLPVIAVQVVNLIRHQRIYSIDGILRSRVAAPVFQRS